MHSEVRVDTDVSDGWALVVSKGHHQMSELERRQYGRGVFRFAESLKLPDPAPERKSVGVVIVHDALLTLVLRGENGRRPRLKEVVVETAGD